LKGRRRQNLTRERRAGLHSTAPRPAESHELWFVYRIRRADYECRRKPRSSRPRLRSNGLERIEFTAPGVAEPLENQGCSYLGTHASGLLSSRCYATGFRCCSFWALTPAPSSRKTHATTIMIKWKERDIFRVCSCGVPVFYFCTVFKRGGARTTLKCPVSRNKV